MKALIAAAAAGACFTASAAGFPVKLAADVLKAVVQMSQMAPAKLVVVADGTGDSLEQAKKEALLSAAKRATGALIVGEQTASGDQLVKDIAIQYSAGIVSSYDIQSCGNEGNRYRCTIKAVVSTEQIRKRVEAAAADQKVDGESMYAQHVSAQASITERRRLARYIIDSLKQSAIDVEITDAAVMPSASEFGQVKVDIRAEFNDDYLESIKQVMSKVSDDSQRVRVDNSTDGVSVLTDWTEQSYPIADAELVASIAASIKAQQVLDLNIRMIDAEDGVIASVCHRYRTAFYGTSIFDVPITKEEAFDARFPPSSAVQEPTIRADHTEQTSIIVPLSPAQLQRMKTVTVAVGCP